MQIKMNENFVTSKVVESGLVWVPTIIYPFVHINIGYLSDYALGWYKQIKHNL
jgi:hypothetical protein